MTTTKSRITATDLSAPLLCVLAAHTNYQAGVPVDQRTIRDEVLGLAGVNTQTTSLPLEGREGLYRRVSFAFRNQTAKYCGVKRAAYCQTSEQKGFWALTEAGVKRARELSQDQNPGVQANPAESIMLTMSRASMALAFSEALEAKVPSAPKTKPLPQPEMRRPRKSGRNLTAQWVADKGVVLIDRLRKHLERRCPDP